MGEEEEKKRKWEREREGQPIRGVTGGLQAARRELPYAYNTEAGLVLLSTQNSIIILYCY